MSNGTEPETLAHHLGRLSIDADNIVDMLEAHHREGGDIHPEALEAASRLQTSLKDVVHALTHHEHLAMDPDDVWAVLGRKHADHESGYS